MLDQIAGTSVWKLECGEKRSATVETLAHLYQYLGIEYEEELEQAIAASLRKLESK